MKYYFVKDIQDKRHIVVAKDEENLSEVLINAGVCVSDSYELKKDTFNDSGFLISDK